MDLLKHQMDAERHLYSWRVGALFMEAGTGKTRVAVNMVNRATNCDAVLWVGPLRTINPGKGLPSVVDEINRWGGFTVPVKYVGIESISGSSRVYLEVREFVERAENPFIVVDESLKIKNITAKRTKRLLELSRLAKYKLILNGTPLSRNILDIYAQMEFLSPKILNMSYVQFKNTFCKYKKITKDFGGWREYSREIIVGYANIDYLYSLIRHYVYECDLSLQVKQLYSDLYYSLDDSEHEEYYRIKEEYLQNEKLLFLNNNIFMAMTTELQHAYCITPDKFRVLDELFTELEKKNTIIFCRFIKSQEECKRRYPEATVLSYQKESLGLNLQHLNATIYFDKCWDYALRVQSGRRTFRTGQKYDCRYYDLTGNVGLEEMINKNIAKKTSMVEYFKGITKEELKKIL